MVIGALNKLATLGPVIESPRVTSMSATSARWDGVTNLEENTWVWKADDPKGDADSDSRANPEQRRTTWETASGDKEEALESHFDKKKAEQADDNYSSPE
ncbi:hypothetical protein NDU88_010259 [Pleurodeles waltl]|uniref:Uncharacterized protein n=1 Tax=Pleurodeles waltl TaxID=8319 RepID=A0AAV7S0S0_PLEWA|nr:hypothetical protein NDU88_010259 [Pleurodeles waltl]